MTSVETGRRVGSTLPVAIRMQRAFVRARVNATVRTFVQKPVFSVFFSNPTNFVQSSKYVRIYSQLYGVFFLFKYNGTRTL